MHLTGDITVFFTVKPYKDSKFSAKSVWFQSTIAPINAVSIKIILNYCKKKNKIGEVL